MNPLHEYKLYKEGEYPASTDEWEDWAERIVTALRAELKAAKKDYVRIERLEGIVLATNHALDKTERLYIDECVTNVYLEDTTRQLGNTIDSQQRWVEKYKADNTWMRQEIERVGAALFTGKDGFYTGTEEDLYAVGQFVEGVCETNTRLMSVEAERDTLKAALSVAMNENQRLTRLLEDNNEMP